MNNRKIVLLTVMLFALTITLSAITAADANDTADTQTLEKTVTHETKTVTTKTEKDIIKEDSKIVKNNQTRNLKTDEQSVDFYVSDMAGSDDNDGSQSTPFKTIQAALDKTTADKTYNIYIGEGTYKGVGNTNLTVNGEHFINIKGTGMNKTILDGEARYDIDPDPGYVWESSQIWWPYINESGNYAMTINRGNALVKLSNLTITNMYSPGGKSLYAYEHANVDNYANLEIDNVMFYSNHGGVGSAIRNNLDSKLTVTNSIFENNTKSSSLGNCGIIYNNGVATISNSLINNNLARWATVLNDNKITVINTTFSNNKGYDGGSTYKYGTGIAANTGNLDFYTPSYYVTSTDVINCTFINDEQCDIYVYSGALNAIGNKFINTTGVYIEDKKDYSYNCNFINNTIDNVLPSSLDSSLSSGSSTQAFRAVLLKSKLLFKDNTINAPECEAVIANNATIANNHIFQDNGTSMVLRGNCLVTNNTLNQKITMAGDNNILTYNTINTNTKYAIETSTKNNIITDNELVAQYYVGDYAVKNTGRLNTIENNTPTIPDNYVFASPNANSENSGTMDNPTTINHALEIVENNGTICLIPDTANVFKTTTLAVNSDCTKEGVTSFNILGLTDNIILSGNNQIFNISEGYTINMENICFENCSDLYGGAIYTESNLTINNSSFNNCHATSGGAIYANKTANIILENNKFTDISADDETLIFNTTGTWTLNNNTYHNSTIQTKTTIFSPQSDKINKVNDTINIEIKNITLTHPTYYDNNILENITYNVYNNEKLIQKTNSNNIQIKVTTPETLRIKVMPEFTNIESNTLEFYVQYDDIIKTVLDTPAVNTYINMPTNITTNINDEFGLKIKKGQISYYTDNTLIATVPVTDGTARIPSPAFNEGKHTITVKYTDNTGTYENTSANAYLNILGDTIYVSPDVTEANSGLINEPTTLEDAMSRLKDNLTIVLLKGNTGIYYLNKYLLLSDDTVKNLKLQGENVTIDGQNNIYIFVTSNPLNLTINNITLKNAEQYTFKGLRSVSLNLTLNNTKFINSAPIGGDTIIIIGNNEFNFKLYRNNDASIRGNNISITGNNSFINNIFTAVRSEGNLYINGNTYFINNSAAGASSDIMLYGNGNLTCINATFIESSITNNPMTPHEYVINVMSATQEKYESYLQSFNKSICIYANTTGEITLINNTFINASHGGIISMNESDLVSYDGIFSMNETLYLNSSKNTLINNNFINSPISYKLDLNLDEQTDQPIKINDTVKININLTLDNPESYDSDILKRSYYDIYLLDQYVQRISGEESSFNIKITDYNEATKEAEITVISSIGNPKHNTIKFDVQLGDLKNVVITSPTQYITKNTPATVMIKITDKDNNPINDVGKVSIYDQDNKLLGTNTTINGITTITTPPLEQIGVQTITIKYETDTLYNNQTSQSLIIVLSSDVYASPDVTENRTGTKEDPTNLQDAIYKVDNGGTVHLLHGRNGIYLINERITLEDQTTKVTTYTIQSDGSKAILDAQGTAGIFQITENMNITLNNIQLINSANNSIINKGTLTINENNTFDNNNAEKYGGAINNEGTLYINNNNTFTNNQAQAGGAIYSKGTATINGKNFFISNQVNPTGIQLGGGAIFVDSSNITITGENEFINNTANGLNAKMGLVFGGAVGLAGSNKISTHIEINGENLFENNQLIANTASYGGAIGTISGDVIINGNNIFRNNLLNVPQNSFGGAVGVRTASITINGSNIFTNNKATLNGGSIGMTGGSKTGALIITGNNRIINSQSSTGGAVYYEGAKNAYLLQINGTTFENITANSGGAIYTTKQKVNTQITNNIFKNIEADQETIMLTSTNTNLILENNTYTNCSIGLSTFTISSELEGQTIIQNTPIPVTITAGLLHPEYYDSDILDKTTYYTCVNDNIKNETNSNTATVQERYTTQNNGTLNIYSKIGENTQSNTITVYLIRPLNTTITVTAPTENTVNKTVPITIILTDENGDLIGQSIISLTNNDKTEEITIANGVTVYQYTPTSVGNDTLTFTYAGNDTLYPTETTITLTVTPDKDAIIEELNNTVTEQNQTIATQEQTIKEQETAIETLNNTTQSQEDKIAEQEKESQAQQQTIKDQANTITDLNKTAQAQQQTIKDQQNTINTQAKQIEQLQKENEALKKQNTTKKSTTIKYTTIKTATKGSTVKITGKLVSDNKAVANQKVTVTVNGKSYTATTTSTGAFTVNHKVADYNVQKVTYAYNGNGEYKASKNTTTFSVTQPTTLKLFKVKIPKKGSTIKVSGKLLDANGKGVKGQTVKIVINGKTYTAKTYSSGYFTIQYKVDSYDKRTVTVTYTGSTLYKASKATTKFYVYRPTSITPYKLKTVKKGTTMKVSGKLVDITGKGVRARTVMVKINKQSYTAKTRNNGYFTVQYTPKTVGTNNVTFTFAGGALYKTSTNSTSFNVKA